MLRRLTAYRVVVTALVALLVVVVFGNSLGVMVTDIKPEVYLAPDEMLGDYLSAWTSSPYLGFPNFNVGLLPVAAALAPGHVVGLSAEMLFKVFHFLLWVVAGVGASRALRVLVPTTGQWSALAAAVAYVANPYAVVGGSTLAILLPYAFLPWLVFALVRALQQPSSWRWPAAFGLIFFAMSGMNVAVVPIFQLLIVPPLAVVVARAIGLGWRSSVTVLSRVAMFVVGVSLYWLVPAVSATSTGLQVASESERLDGIARVSSLVEVLRGMGMWSLYGSGPSGPWVPEFAPYLSNPVLVTITLAWPVLALLALAWAPPVLRQFCAVAIGLVSVVLVGFFPGTVSTPLAWVVDQILEAVPPLVAFRTTNKAGAVLSLVFALLLGHAVPVWLASLARRRLRIGAVALVCGIVAAWVLPALTGSLYTSPIDVPGYWRAAAAAVDAQSRDSRVLLLPNQIRSSYRWTDERPDDVTNSLIGRGAIIPESSPNASPPGANYLAALGDLVASSTAAPGTVSTMARYLGSGDVLLRHDIRWEESAGVRPQVSASMLGSDPGLVGMQNFGLPGENVVGPAGPTGFEASLPPLQHYAVAQPLPTVSARSTESEVTVAGDAWAFDPMSRTGALRTTPVISYAGDLRPQDLAARLGSEHRLVLTDTNRRQAAIPNRLVAGYGPLLPPTQTPTPTRALGDAGTQTVQSRSGPAVTASQVGSAFFDTPYGQPDNAIDGDLDTSWLFGDFRRAPGATMVVSWPDTQRFTSVTIRPTALGPVQLDRVTVSAGGVSRTVTLPATGTTVVDLGGVIADRFSLRVESVRGQGFSLVGIAELGLPGTSAVRVARVPTTFDRLYEGLDRVGRRDFADTPFDVSFTRVANGAGQFDDTETALLRDFTLPVARSFTASAQILLKDRSEGSFDRLSGRLGPAEATSSGVYFDNPDLRASMASDDDPGTGWVPGGEIVGAWWQIVGPTRAIPHIDVVQRLTSSSAPAKTATRVAIEVDGVQVAVAATLPGATRIPVPQGTTGRAVRVVILAVGGPEAGTPPQFTTIDAGLETPSPLRPACVTVARLDGSPLQMRPVSLTDVAGAGGSAASSWEACGEINLQAGAHTLRAVDGFVLDSLDLADALGVNKSDPVCQNIVTSTSGRDTNQRINVGATPEHVILKIGQSFDPRWRASVGGVDLGPAEVVDGWSVGWRLAPGEARTVLVRFEPQRSADIAVGASVAALIFALVLVLPRKADRRSTRSSAPPADVFVGWGTKGLGPGPKPWAAWWAPTLAGLAMTLGFGLPGLLGALVGGVLHRLAPRPLDLGIFVGAALVAMAGLTQVLSTSGSWGLVDAAAPAASMWPHWIAAVGLATTVVSALSVVSASNNGPEEVRGD